MSSIPAATLAATAGPAVRTYLRALVVLSVKSVVLALLTSRSRLSTAVFATPEDAAEYAGRGLFRALTATRGHPKDAKKIVRGSPAAAASEAERWNGLHHHTLENALPWALVGLALVASGASEGEASLYCWGWLALRCLHSFIYIVVRRQPFRGLCWSAQLVLIAWGAALSLSRL